MRRNAYLPAVPALRPTVPKSELSANQELLKAMLSTVGGKPPNINKFDMEEKGDGQPELLVSPHITLKMQSADGGVVLFRARRLMPLGKLKDAYCSQMGLTKDLASLSFDGERIDESETASSLQLEEGDLMDVRMRNQQAEAGDGRG